MQLHFLRTESFVGVWSSAPAEGDSLLKTLRFVFGFLVSIAPETKEANLAEYTQTINECGIFDFKHKGLLLEITFTDGSVYEYFGVKPDMYKKLINADSQVRFAKRSIYNSFTYRKSKKGTEE